MKTALMIAEKPSLANSLANILSNNKNTTKKGYKSNNTIYEWKGNFRGENIIFRMTSVCGHVMTSEFVGKYNSWDKVEPIELFKCPTEKKEAVPQLKMLHFLENVSRDCDYLILWLDCDKEGENICFEVMKAVSKSIKNVYNENVTFRAHFSAITEKDIKFAMNNLRYPNENESKSVDARQELDLRLGCAFTRFQTKFFQGKYGNLDAALISYGPCQTPTLGFCVKRHDEIQTFKPENYWYLQLNAGNPNIVLDWERVRLFNKELVNMIRNKIKNCKEAEVESITTKEMHRPRPQGLNTVELLKAASSGLGMGPHQTMMIAEKLYIQGYISYPRTETTQYPENFDLLGTARLFLNSKNFGESAKSVIDNFNKPRKGSDLGDHPPITPMKYGDIEKNFDNDTCRLYNYIVKHFLASLSVDLKYTATTAKLKVDFETFTVTSNILIDPGYTKIMDWQSFNKNECSFSFKEGDVLPINSIAILEGQTGPPDYLTESELITLMEKHGIGTDASIPVHVNNICQRNFVTVGSGRKLIPTSLGVVLVHGYQKIDIDLVSPTMRSEVENLFNLIARGKANYTSVLNHAIDIFREKFIYFIENISAMDSLFEVSFSRLCDTGKALSRCGKCRRYMKYIQAASPRLHCSHCNETYAIPSHGNVKSFRELKCPLDDFELLAFSSGTKGTSYPLCPYCYNNPPFEDVPKASGCNLCTHPTCQYSLNTLGVSNCIECNNGVLVLDITSAPSSWKLCCNRCDVIINIFKGAINVKIKDERCDCLAQLLTVKYKPDNTKFKDSSTEKTGCIFCSSEFLHLIEKHRAAFNRPAQTYNRGRGVHSSRGNRGNRGSRNSRGIGSRSIPFVRGRGRGNTRQPKDKMALLDAYFV